MNDMGKLLIQDGGKGSSEINRIWRYLGINFIAMCAITIVVFLVTSDFSGHIFIGRNRIQMRDVADLMRAVTVALTILVPSALLYVSIMAKCGIEKQEIYVYEKGIKGVAATPKSENEGHAAFSLTYGLIESVDTIDNGKRISINTSARQYTLFVNNPTAVIDAVRARAGGSQ